MSLRLISLERPPIRTKQFPRKFLVETAIRARGVLLVRVHRKKGTLMDNNHRRHCWPYSVLIGRRLLDRLMIIRKSALFKIGKLLRMPTVSVLPDADRPPLVGTISLESASMNNAVLTGNFPVKSSKRSMRASIILLPVAQDHLRRRNDDRHRELYDLKVRILLKS